MDSILAVINLDVIFIDISALHKNTYTYIWSE